VKTDVGQVDLVLRLSDGTSEKKTDSQTCRYDVQIYFHWYKILGLLYERALFDLQFVRYKYFSGSFQPDQEKACNICPFQGFNISQKPKSSPLSYFAQKISLNLVPN
jgi:hypothetical protein